MKSITYFSILKKILLLGALFMLGESIYHFSGIRLQGAYAIWSPAAYLFGQFFMWLWASASLFMALVLWYCYRHLDQVQPLIVLLGGFSFFHAAVLYHFSTLPLTQIWALTPAVFVWFQGYTFQLKVEAALLIAFGLFIMYGWKHGFLKTKKHDFV